MHLKVGADTAPPFQNRGIEQSGLRTTTRETPNACSLLVPAQFKLKIGQGATVGISPDVLKRGRMPTCRLGDLQSRVHHSSRARRSCKSHENLMFSAGGFKPQQYLCLCGASVSSGPTNDIRRYSSSCNSSVTPTSSLL